MNIIAVWNPKGGNGKTTLALNIAACYRFLKKSVMVIDLDKQKSLHQISKSSYLDFQVNTQFPTYRPTCDVLVVDYPAQCLSIDIPVDIIVTPVLPSRIDHTAFSDAHLNLDSATVPTLYVLNRVDLRIRAQQAIWVQAKTTLEAILVKSRSIYPRTMDAHMTVFDKNFNTTYGTQQARAEIRAVVSSIENTIRCAP